MQFDQWPPPLVDGGLKIGIRIPQFCGFQNMCSKFRRIRIPRFVSLYPSTFFWHFLHSRNCIKNWFGWNGFFLSICLRDVAVHLSVIYWIHSLREIYSNDCNNPTIAVCNEWHIKKILKEQFNETFEPQFFSSFELAWVTDQWVKIFSKFVSFSPRYSNFYEALHSIILRRVKLCTVSYCAESSSAQYDTVRSQVTFQYPFKRESQARFSNCFFPNSSLPWPLSNGLKYFRIWFIFRVFRDWLRTVSYCVESLYTARSRLSFLQPSP